MQVHLLALTTLRSPIQEQPGLGPPQCVIHAELQSCAAGHSLCISAKTSDLIFQCSSSVCYALIRMDLCAGVGCWNYR